MLDGSNGQLRVPAPLHPGRSQS